MDSLQWDHRVDLVLEYVEGDSLASQIHLLRKRTDKRLWFPMKQIADAVEYMHSRNIVHRDIKLENVLYSNKGVMKVIGFNIATRFKHGQKFHDVWGTPGDMAPEITEHGYEGPPVDVWALGVLFTTFFVGLQFDGRNIIQVSIVYNGAIIMNACEGDADAEGVLREGSLDCFTYSALRRYSYHFFTFCCVTS
uniref:uncharacterized protein n=1 Tax=Myxine glutinosa TaxID=7769 RepID=UPI00358E04E5